MKMLTLLSNARDTESNWYGKKNLVSFHGRVSPEVNRRADCMCTWNSQLLLFLLNFDSIYYFRITTKRAFIMPAINEISHSCMEHLRNPTEPLVSDPKWRKPTVSVLCLALMTVRIGN